MAVHVLYAVYIRTPQGNYVTLTIAAINDTAAASAAREMVGGGEVAYIKRLD